MMLGSNAQQQWVNGQQIGNVPQADWMRTSAAQIGTGPQVTANNAQYQGWQGNVPQASLSQYTAPTLGNYDRADYQTVQGNRIDNVPQTSVGAFSAPQIASAPTQDWREIQAQQIKDIPKSDWREVTPGQMSAAQVQGGGVDPNSAIQRALSGDPNNPYLASMAKDMQARTNQSWQDIQKSMNDTLQEQILPGVEDEFNASGALGASRQALLEGQAVGKTNEALAKQGKSLSDNLAGQLAGLYGNANESAQARAAAMAGQMGGPPWERVSNMFCRQHRLVNDLEALNGHRQWPPPPHASHTHCLQLQLPLCH
jgi:hypothetical protein